jgi:hypothetical protein
MMKTFGVITSQPLMVKSMSRFSSTSVAFWSRTGDALIRAAAAMSWSNGVKIISKLEISPSTEKKRKLESWGEKR